MGKVLASISNGFPGTVSRSIDNVIISLKNNSGGEIPFGAPVFLQSGQGACQVFDADTSTEEAFLGFTVRAGVISMLTLILKGFFALLASYILIATTTIEKICYALRLLFVPKILVTEVLLIYRYITLLLAETERITQAYALRAPGQKGVHFRVWGSLAGLLLLRSMDRAGEVYESMSLRGYSGDFQYMADKTPLRAGDLLFGAVWIALFVLFRSVPVLTLVGNLFVR